MSNPTKANAMILVYFAVLVSLSLIRFSTTLFVFAGCFWPNFARYASFLSRISRSVACKVTTARIG
jgi:hypothetical protein